MSEENEFESLFAEFDQTSEKAAPPPIPEQFSYTRARHVGAWTRLLRWIVQGPGLLLGFYLIFLTQIVKEPEAGMNLPGTLLCLWLITPLLGTRPLAHPLRIAVLLIPSMMFLIFNSALVRCGIENVESQKSPIRYLSKAVLTSLEKATEPVTVAGLAVVLIALILAGRKLALISPWVETQLVISRWRRGISYLVLGLSLGLLLSLPLAYRLAWSQPWLNTPELESTQRILAKEAPNDLGELLPELLKNAKRGSFTPEQQLGFYRTATQRLQNSAPLTVRDLAVLRKLVLNVVDPKLDPTMAEFSWEAFRRCSLGELSPYGVHNLVVLQLIPQLAASQDLEFWEERLSGLEVQPMTPMQTDAAVATAIRKESKRWQSPGRRHMPLHLFGQATRIDHYQFPYQVENTAKILLYLKVRRAVGTSESLTGVLGKQKPWLVQGAWQELSKDLAVGLGEQSAPKHYLYIDNHQLLKNVLEMKSIKAKTGLYPAEAPNLPLKIIYRTSVDRTTASLEIPQSNTPYTVTLP